MTDDFFSSRLDQIDRPRSPLGRSGVPTAPGQDAGQSGAAVCAQRASLQQIEASPDLVGPVVRVSGGKASNAGHPRLALRLMIALTLLKNSFDLSDEELVGIPVGRLRLELAHAL